MCMACSNTCGLPAPATFNGATLQQMRNFAALTPSSGNDGHSASELIQAPKRVNGTRMLAARLRSRSADGP